MSDPHIAALFGRHAIHIPLNLIVQDMTVDGHPAIVAVAQAQGPHILPVFFADIPRAHTLIMGDVVIRPRLVYGSDHLVGAGLSGIARDGFTPEEWIAKGTVLLDNH